MPLREYSSLKEKEDFFQSGSSRIDDIKSFNYIFLHYMNIEKGDLIFRGVNEAKYKLYTSAQRCFIEQNLENKYPRYSDFIFQLILQCRIWNNGAIPKRLKQMGIKEDNYLAYLSSLQHSANPSPCIDFTLNPLIALFFAFHNCKKSQNTEIDSYVSLYMITTQYVYFKDISNSILKGIQMRNFLNGEKNEITLNNKFAFSAFFQMDNPFLTDITNNISFKTINTMNIIYQEGRLIFNPSSDQPMEEVSKEILKGANTGWRDLKCININKNLKEHALQLLSQVGYSKERIFQPSKSSEGA